MARNKYPEETVKLILDVATHLFVEKGYDATSYESFKRCDLPSFLVQRRNLRGDFSPHRG